MFYSCISARTVLTTREALIFTCSSVTAPLSMPCSRLSSSPLLPGMTRWAFAQQDVDFVEAETDPDNRASQRILEKCGFVPNGETGKEGPRFVVERPQTT